MSAVVIAICKNVVSEGPGTIEDFLRARELPYKIAELTKGEPLPGAAEVSALVMMGGPMSVNDYGELPYIAREVELAGQCIRGGKPVLGICLGSQIMAKALGATVYPGLAKEIGWHDIELTAEGLEDPLMIKLASNPQGCAPLRSVKVFHWHGETFDIPDGAVRLAGSALYENQAFRYGRCAYAFQFHVEVTRQMIVEWLTGEHVDIDRIMSETDRYYEAYHSRTLMFYNEFFGLTISRPGSASRLPACQSVDPSPLVSKPR